MRRVAWKFSDSQLVPAERETLRFCHKRGMLRNVLLPQVPRIAGAVAAELLGASLVAAGVRREQITGWILHTGGREVILAILGPGEFFGEMALLDDETRSATVIAIEPCELLSIAKSDFKRCLAENMEISMGVMRGLVKRLREADRKIGSLALMDVYGRVARLLLEMSEDVNGQKVVCKRLPKQDIAKMIGASREMVSRVMKDLQTSGYIEVRSGSIFLRENISMAH